MTGAEQARALLARWVAEFPDVLGDYGPTVSWPWRIPGVVADFPGENDDEANASFIALARTAAPEAARHALALADALERIESGDMGIWGDNADAWKRRYEAARQIAREALRAFNNGDAA